MLNLDFDGHNTLYATHGIHSYAAKCPPQLAKFALETYSSPNELVLDPMVGSGTTLVEAKLSGRNAIGYDIDPLACLIARVKSNALEDKQISEAYHTVIDGIEQDLVAIREGGAKADVIERTTSPEFYNRDYWFEVPVQQSLSLLSYHIAHTPMSEGVREFLWVAFSAVILTKVSVANARDIIHSRHHYIQHLVTPDVISKFCRRVKQMRRQMTEFRERLSRVSPTSVNVYMQDSRLLPLEKNAIDLVFTSPPYATALDYTRAHFLSISWMQKSLGTTLEVYKAQGGNYIGSERGRTVSSFNIDERLADYYLARSTIEQLVGIDRKKAFHIQRYFLDMLQVFSEINRVLKPGKHAVIVVCPSHIRKIDVPTHKVFTEFGQYTGLELVEEYTRTINGGRRVLPYTRDTFGERMSTEYVLIYRKMEFAK